MTELPCQFSGTQNLGLVLSAAVQENGTTGNCPCLAPLFLFIQVFFSLFIHFLFFHYLCQSVKPWPPLIQFPSVLCWWVRMQQSAEFLKSSLQAPVSSVVVESCYLTHSGRHLYHQHAADLARPPLNNFSVNKASGKSELPTEKRLIQCKWL